MRGLGACPRQGHEGSGLNSQGAKSEQEKVDSGRRKPYLPPSRGQLPCGGFCTACLEMSSVAEHLAVPVLGPEASSAAQHPNLLPCLPASFSSSYSDCLEFHLPGKGAHFGFASDCFLRESKSAQRFKQDRTLLLYYPDQLPQSTEGAEGRRS